jgi:hypothetical protein
LHDLCGIHSMEVPILSVVERNVHTNSDSAKREKEAVTFLICVRTMWYEEKVSNFEIAVAKLKETLQNIKFATLCLSVA